MATLALVLLVAVAFLFAGREAVEGLPCVVPVVILVGFPIAYAISSTLPQFSTRKNTAKASASESSGRAEHDRSADLRGLQSRRPVWWVTLVVAGIALLVFAYADWVTDHQLSVLRILAGLALLAGGVAQWIHTRGGESS